MVSHPVLVPNLIIPLNLLKIKDVDDAWRIGHKLADIDNFYSHHINLKQNTFPEMETKRCLIGRVVCNLYDMLEDANPSISLVELEDLLFRDHFFKESILELACSGYGKHELPAREAVRLAWLFYGLPIDKSK
jgi:hypothetical protein